MLLDANSGQPTGASLVRYIGAGGMAAVFLAEVDTSKPLLRLRPDAPARIAVKFMLPEAERQFARNNIDPTSVFRKEQVALGRVTERRPPTEFVVSFYGSGTTSVSIASAQPRRLPWIAIEYVDGGIAGTSLTDRVGREPDGIDPVRALRLVTGIIEGVRVLHSDDVRVIHRDLKPDNVLVAGPIDDETPKIADCGIARVTGLLDGTFQARTPAYGGPEQGVLLAPHQAGPLIGTWTDVHALAAVVWFVCGGEDWCRHEEADREWQSGVRRSLRTASRLHTGFAGNTDLLDRLDEVLTRGAARRLPEVAWMTPEADQFRKVPQGKSLSATGPERYATVDAFASDLLPVLSEFAQAWIMRAARGNRAATAFRPTQLIRAEHLPASALLAHVREPPQASLRWTQQAFASLTPSFPGVVVFQPDGKILARFGARLLYFVGGEPYNVAVDAAYRDAVETSHWIVRGPGGGFAIVGSSRILLIRGGRFASMTLPVRTGGGAVGELCTVLGDGRVFAVVTAETDDSNGGAELWRSTDGMTWSEPTVLSLNGDVHAVADGPFGLLAVGSKGGKKGRALFLGLDGQTTVQTNGVNDKPPLVAAVCGAARESWAAGVGVVLMFDRGRVIAERVEANEAVASMALDVVGVPWLVTERRVLRRHLEGGEGVWKAYYRRGAERPALVGIGFTPDGARVLDANGGIVEIEPLDIGEWGASRK
jgi:hypothetical protein